MAVTVASRWRYILYLLYFTPILPILANSYQFLPILSIFTMFQRARISPSGRIFHFYRSQRSPNGINLPETMISARSYTSRTAPDIPARIQRMKWPSTAFLSAVVIGGAATTYFNFAERVYAEKAEAVKQLPDIVVRNLKWGGENNLPIARFLIDDSQDKEIKDDRPRLVILGTGWGAISVIKQLEKEKYHVTVVSPTNYFLFTPLLPSATVGTLELRSLLEPIRRILWPIRGHYLNAEAVDVDFKNHLVQVKDGNNKEFYVPYDKLVIAVGSQSVTHGVHGLVYCHLLKSVDDVRKIRSKVMENFEKASLPTTTVEERKRLLSFVICGGGPTGVEFAAEIYDWVTEDLANYFPKALQSDISVSIIQSRDHILNTYDSKISTYTEGKFRRDGINVIVNAKVQEVLEDKVVYQVKAGAMDDMLVELPYGLCLWSTGVGMTSFAKNLSTRLDEQKNKRALETDSHLRLKGVTDSSVYCIGDCSTIENPRLIDHIIDIFKEADKENHGYLTYSEFQESVRFMLRKFPLTTTHLQKLRKLFDTYDEDRSGTLDLHELRHMLQDIDNKMTSLPATAQVANQQGKYLGRILNKLTWVSTPTDDKNMMSYLTSSDDQADPFIYKHLGSLAYIGNSAVGDIGPGYTILGGIWALYLWRSIYWSEQVSMRTRILLALDWSKLILFGRDLSKVT